MPTLLKNDTGCDMTFGGLLAIGKSMVRFILFINIYIIQFYESIDPMLGISKIRAERARR